MGLDYKLLTRTGAVHAEEGRPAVAAADLNPPWAVVELVPESVARENLVFPLSLDGDTLTCAAADPTNLLVQDKLSFILNKRVRFVPARPEAIRAAIDRHYGRTETESTDSMLRDFGGTAADSTWRDRPVRLARSVFGNLPGLGRSLGKPVTEFKRGVRGLAADYDEGESISDIVREVVSPDTRYPGLDPTGRIGNSGMLHYVVEEGQRALMVTMDGRMEVVVGPKRVWRGRKSFRPMKHFVAHPAEFLIVRFRDGRQQHIPGPAEVWFDPRVHLSISREDALQVAAREAVVVYRRAGQPADRQRPDAARPGPRRVAAHVHLARGRRRVRGGPEGRQGSHLPETLADARPDVPRCDRRPHGRRRGVDHPPHDLLRAAR